jgi:hypothetical protein
MERGIARFAPLTGALAVALGVLALILNSTWSDSPEDDASGAEIAAWMTDESWAIFFSSWVWWLAIASFVWFLGSLRAVLRRGERGEARVTSIAFGAGVMFAVFGVSFVAPLVAGASADEFSDRTVTPETADVLWVAGHGFVGAAELFGGILALATALVVLRTGVLPKWYGWLGGLYGLWLLIWPLGWIGFFGFPIWILLTTALVWMAESKATTPEVAGA